jgi:hypothetical protein
MRPRWLLRIVATACLVALAGCETPPPPPTPAETRALLVRLLPASLADRDDWAYDIQAAFQALEIEPSVPNLCATLAITEQESGFNANPPVPGLGRIALAEIERRAARKKIPRFLVRAALGVDSANGQSYGERLAAVRTERDLSRLYEEFIDSVPLGRRLLQGANPVHTGGAMQVSIDFAERHARRLDFPFPSTGSVRSDVFTRRGGLYFGIAHLLGYPASYPSPLFRFADFNAGFYASRNAAFQQAVSRASGIALALDGDLVVHESKSGVGATETAVQSLSTALDMSDEQIHRALQKGNTAKFERSELYRRVFELAERLERKPLPRAILPRIDLKSPKITRRLTTEWFATRVDQRYRRCLAKAAGQ